MGVGFTIFSAVALFVLLYSEVRDSKQLRYVSKPLASLGFIAVGFVHGDLATTYAALIVAGLILGAVGDVALMFESERAFLVGLVAFLLGHVAYVVAFANVAPLGSWLTPWAIVPLVISAVILRWLWPHLGKMRGPVIAYVVVISSMVLGALGIALEGTLSPRATTLAVSGALLFYASDIAVARNKFVAPAVGNRLWGLPAYYAGQLLIAWSLA